MSVTELRDALNAEIEKGNGNKDVNVVVQCWPNPYESCYYPQKLNFDSSCDTVEIKCVG